MISQGASIPVRFIAPDGQAERELPVFADRAALISFYRAMLLTRIFDEKAVALQRTGRLGTFASSLGQEAVSVGLASAMRKEDVLLPSFREQGAMLWRGVSLVELFLYWGGDERGSDFAGPREDFPICIPVASHAPHAAGVALAMKLRGEKRAAVAVMGDGATSKGDFYEAINISGVWRLPAVFVISNNQWAISVPVGRQTAAATLAVKAMAAGIQSARVDGNDVIAVHDAVGEAIDRAISDQGPTLVECVTYRLGDHTTVDDSSRYRSDQEVSENWPSEPVARLRQYLTVHEGWAKSDEENLIAECHNLVGEAADRYAAIDPLEPKDMFEMTFASLPRDLEEQRNQLS